MPKKVESRLEVRLQVNQTLPNESPAHQKRRKIKFFAEAAIKAISVSLRRQMGIKGSLSIFLVNGFQYTLSVQPH